MSEQAPELDDAWRYGQVKKYLDVALSRLKDRDTVTDYTAGRMFGLEEIAAYIRGLDTPSDPTPSRTES